MAPEVISSTHYDNRCDVFSFGIIMFQTLTQCSDNDIYPINKLNGKNIDFMLSTDPNFRPVINENLNSNQEFIDYIGFKFFIFIFYFLIFRINDKVLGL
jgi:serine/threonine protein kinase